MTRKNRYRTAAGSLLLGLLALCFSLYDPMPPAPVIKAPVDLVRFTATRSFTRLPLDEQLRYLMQWGRTPAADRSKVIADLMKEPYLLELSSANSSQTMQLAQAREYFAAAPADRNALMDKVIDDEQAMRKANDKVMKDAEKQAGAFQPKVGDQKLRKLLIESTPPEVRVELAAFSQAKFQRMRDRGLSTNT
jgi:hypothetical protein